MKRFGKFSCFIMALLLALPGCTALDVVGNDATRAFGDILSTIPAEAVQAGGWSIASPDNAAWLEWDEAGLRMIVAAEPFINAGLMVDLPLGGDSAAHRLVYSTPALIRPAPGADPLGQFQILTQSLRDSIGYHMETDRYHFMIEDKTMLEWAKTITANGPLVVFILDSAPLLEAGVRPGEVAGWTYTQLTMHSGGRPVTMWKFIKPVYLP